MESSTSLSFFSMSEKEMLLVSSEEVNAGGQMAEHVEGSGLMALQGPSLAWTTRKKTLARRAAGQPM